MDVFDFERGRVSVFKYMTVVAKFDLGFGDFYDSCKTGKLKIFLLSVCSLSKDPSTVIY